MNFDASPYVNVIFGVILASETYSRVYWKLRVCVFVCAFACKGVYPQSDHSMR